MDLNKQANTTKEELETQLTAVTERLKPLISRKAAAAIGLGNKRSTSSRLATASKTNSGSQTREVETKKNRGRNQSDVNASRNCD